MNITRLRLQNQHLNAPVLKDPADLVRAFGAVQAQDYLASQWAIAQRLTSATDSDVDQAIAARTIVRSWPLRGTLHLVAAADLRWMLELSAPGTIAKTALRHRQLELDKPTLAKCAKVLARALRDGQQLTRAEIAAVLLRAGVSTEEQRLPHILLHLSVDRLICHGPRRGKQFTYTLLDQWVPHPTRLTRDEALAELATRYFNTRGPATAQDFAWWSGLAAADVRAAVAMVATQFESETVAGVTYLLPGGAAPARSKRPVYLLAPYDEYLIAYRDRTAMIDAKYADGENPRANSIFNSIVVIDGRVRGMWRRVLEKKGVAVTAEPFEGEFSPAEARAIRAVATRYAAFLGVPLLP